VAAAAREQPDEVIDTTTGVVPAAAQLGFVGFVTRLDGRDGLRAAVHVVDREHDIGEQEQRIGQAEVIARRRRQPLDVADGVVADEADGAAEEARQPGDGDGSDGAQPGIEIGQRIRRRAGR